MDCKNRIIKLRESTYTLLGDIVYEGTGSEIKVGSIADNRYYASVSFEETGEFNILLGQDWDKSISLTAEGGKVFFKMTGGVHLRPSLRTPRRNGMSFTSL